MIIEQKRSQSLRNLLQAESFLVERACLGALSSHCEIAFCLNCVL